MSRIGKMPIPVPDGVKVAVAGPRVKVTGPKGVLERTFHPDMSIAQEAGVLLVRRPSDLQQHRALHGLTRSLLNNMVVGVTEGLERQLMVEGTGYRGELDGKALVMQLGFSHPVRFEEVEGIEYGVEDRGKRIIVRGIDKEKVGQAAVRIRDARPPEPYKGKGVRYRGEYVRRKAGKAGKVGV